MALVPSPAWLDTGDNAWQLAAGTFVALQSIPGLTVLYGGIVKKKWAINSAFMSIYAFVSVMIVWVLFDYNMAFGPQWFSFVGMPGLAMSASFLTGQATIPAAAAGMPPLAFPMATLMWFQFVFAAITVIILAGSVLGRMSFKAWMLFCPIWMTLVYTVGAFSLWGGGWLAGLGVADFSGGYVIHLAAASSGFTAAWVIGPRLQADRDSFPPNSLLMTLAGAGILWLGWNGFNGGDPYFANADAGAAVMNTQLAACTAVFVWTLMDMMAYGKPSVIGAVNGMIAGLVAITPASGFVLPGGSLVIGIAAGVWQGDWPNGYGFLDSLTAGNAISPTDNTNISELNDSVVNNLFVQSATATGAARTAIWSQIDEQVMKDAAILPGIYQKTVLYRSAHLTNVYVQAYYGMYNYAVLGVSS